MSAATNNDLFWAKNGLYVSNGTVVANSSLFLVNLPTTINASLTVAGNSTFNSNVSITGLLSVTANLSVNTTLFIDTVNGKMGLNNVAPPYALTITSTDSVLVPIGNTSQRSANGINGLFRYNTDISNFEGYVGGAWKSFNVSGNVISYPPGGTNTSYQYNLSGVFQGTDTYYVGTNTGFGNTTPNAKVQIQGTANVSGNVVIGSTLGVVGALTAQNTFVLTGNATFSNTLAVIGAVTLSNTLNVTGLTTLATLTVTGAATINGAATLSNTATVAGLITATSGIQANANSDFGNNDVTGLKIKCYKEEKVTATIASNTYIVDFSQGNVFDLTSQNTSVTLIFSNFPATGNSYSFQLWLKQDAVGSRGWIFATNTNIKWPGGSTPTFSTTASVVDIVQGQTLNGGTTVQGALSLANTAY